jgi:hypothetical protein
LHFRSLKEYFLEFHIKFLIDILPRCNSKNLLSSFWPSNLGRSVTSGKIGWVSAESHFEYHAFARKWSTTYWVDDIGLYESENSRLHYWHNLCSSQLSGIMPVLIISLKTLNRHLFAYLGQPRCRVIAPVQSFFELIYCERVSQPTKLRGPTTIWH